MFQIEWTSTAKETYSEILSPLSMNAGLQLNDSVENLLDKLEKFSHLCPSSSFHSSIRSCKIDKKISLAYQVDGKIIRLLQFYFNKSSIDW